MSVQGNVTQDEPMGRLARFRQFRRRHVKKWGKRLVRGASDFLASQSLIKDVPVFDNALFPFLDVLEDNWRLIREELENVLQDRDKIPAFQEISPDQKRIAFGDRWKTFIFYGFGYRADDNCARCPHTVRILESIPNLKTAWFSILSPGYHVPAHRGVTKGIIRVHLGLIVPKDRDNCYMRVGDQICHWDEGKYFVFDDTYDHEVFNNTDEDRVVLLLDFDRPMKWPGRLFNWIFLSGIRHTAYVQDGLKNLKKWQERQNTGSDKK